MMIKNGKPNDETIISTVRKQIKWVWNTMSISMLKLLIISFSII